MSEISDISLISRKIEADFLIDLGIRKKEIIINTKFLLIITILHSQKQEIKVYDLNSLSLLGSIKFENISCFVKFHKHLESIFFVCIAKNVFIYQIDSENQKISELSVIKGHFSNVIFADFSRYEPDILVSVSEIYDIKLYNVKESLPISHIFLNESLNVDIDLKWNEKDMGIKSGKKIIIAFNYLLFIPENIKNISFDEIVIDFHFYEKKIFSLIVLTQKDIQYVSLEDEKKLKIKINEFYKIGKEYFNNFYSQDRKILLIFFNDEIQIFKLNYPKIELIFTYNLDNSGIYDPIFLFDEKQLEENELCKFYNKKKSAVDLFSITFKKSKNNQKDIYKPKQKLEDLLKNIIKNISDIPILLSKENNMEIIYENNKKYFKYKEINEELDEIRKRNLLQRKEIVIKNLDQTDLSQRKENLEKDIDQIKSINDMKERYIIILKLLINDNTNQKLIYTYLQFLIDNKKELKICYKDNYEEYQKELNYCLNIISVEDYFKLTQKIKRKQKDELINFMDDLIKYNEKEIIDFEKYLNSFEDFEKKTIYYNMPVDSNNEELCYYGYLCLVKYSLKNINKLINEKKKEINNNNEIDEKTKIEKKIKIVKDEMDLLIHKTIKTIDYLKKNLFNPEKIRYLMILLVQSTSIKEFYFGYNLITSKKMGKNDIVEFKKKNEIEKNYNIKYEKNYDYICLNNLDIYSQDLVYSKKIYNYEYYKKKYEEKYHLSFVKQFYKKILPLKCFKSIYSTLYGDEYYPFEDQNYTNEFIDKYYHFIPMKLEESNGMTDKFSMNIFIVSFLPKVEGKGNCKKLEQKLLREGLIINISNHEIGHDFVMDHFFMENARIPIETPRKKTLDAEGGYYIEYALYGRRLESINMEQALYILNENNYNKTYLEFQEGFNNIKKEDLILEGVFKEMFKDIKLEEIDTNEKKNLYLPLNPIKLKEKIIVRSLKNDVIGRRISDETYNEMQKKYS